MYKLPPDLEETLKKKHPEIDIPKFIHELITEIVDKTTRDGATQIREFGNFTSFKVLNERKDKHEFRFKFKVSGALTKRFNNDQYIMDKLTFTPKSEFTETHIANLADKKENRERIRQTEKAAIQHAKEQTKENENYNAIMNLIHS